MTQQDWFLIEGVKDASATDLMVEALFKLTIASFNELVKHSGTVDALAAVRPYRAWGAKVHVNEARKRLEVHSDGPDAMLMMHAFGGLACGVPQDEVVGEVKEKGAIGIFRGCPFAGVGSPELCMSISHFVSEVEADATNPEYECIWTQHESSGDSYCRYVFKKKTDPISVLDDMGSTLIVLPKFEIPEGQLQATRLWAVAGFVWQNTDAFLHLHGEEMTEEVIGTAARRIGQEMGDKLSQQNAELKESVASVGNLVRAMQNALGQRDNYVIVSENEVANEVVECSQSDIHTSGCEKIFEPLFQGLVSSINPELEFAYDRMMSKGDPTCHWMIRRKAASHSDETSLEILKKRFARGEIAKDEFLEMKALLEG